MRLAANHYQEETMGDDIRTFQLQESDGNGKQMDAKAAKEYAKLYEKLPAEWQGYIDRYAKASVERLLAERANKAAIDADDVVNNEGKLIRTLNSYTTTPDGKRKDPAWIEVDEDKEKKVMLENGRALFTT